MRCYFFFFFFFFKQKTAYEMRISDWSSDVCSSDLHRLDRHGGDRARRLARGDQPARDIHLRQHPSAKDVSVRVDVSRGGDHPQRQFLIVPGHRSFVFLGVDSTPRLHRLRSPPCRRPAPSPPPRAGRKSPPPPPCRAPLTPPRE